MPKKVVFIIGHTGAGKSLLAIELGKYYDCPILSYSNLGRIQGVEDSEEIVQQNESLFIQELKQTIAKTDMLLAEGVSSPRIVETIRGYGVEALAISLNVPYHIRIQRIMQREKCSEEQAISIEGIKERAKNKVGLSDVLEFCHEDLDGTLPPKEVLNKAIKLIEGRNR